MRLAILLWRQRARSMCQDREARLGALGAVMVGAEEAGHVAAGWTVCVRRGVG